MKILNYFFFVLVLVLVGCVAKQQFVKPPVPELFFTTSASELEPGHSIKITATIDQPNIELKVKGWWLGEILLTPVSMHQGQYEHYVAVPLDIVPGAYSITITAYFNQKVLVTKKSLINIKQRSPFKTIKLWIKSFGKYDFASESALMTRARELALEKHNVYAAIQKFDWPIKGRLSETFGVKRIYNNGMDSWYHGGFDIAAPGGTVIKAPADGYVILSKDFVAHGKTILIDHGYGIVTTYLHQSKRLVREGDLVKKGQPIGHVGTTGSSTGNHLHFQININNIITNPHDFINLSE